MKPLITQRVQIRSSFAARVYEGLSEQKIAEIERIALNRCSFVTLDYQLLDFGRGRRLERFGEFVLDRPCPAVREDGKRRIRSCGILRMRVSRMGARPKDDGFFPRKELPERWTIACDQIRFELKCTPFGQVGLFPEQAENWEWIGAQSREVDHHRLAATQRGARIEGGEAINKRFKLLNLFAYTGGSTLAAAAGGLGSDAYRRGEECRRLGAAECGTVGLGRRAPSAGSPKTPWKFVQAGKSKRGSRYDALILDPALAMGNGPPWRGLATLQASADVAGSNVPN